MYVAKIIARIVNVGQQLFTPYGRGFIIPKHALPPSCPPTLLSQTAVSVSKHASSPSCPPTLLLKRAVNLQHLDTHTSSIPTSVDSGYEIIQHTILQKRYGYSTDSLWEITMTLPEDRESRRQLTSHIRNTAITEKEAVSYLLALDGKILQLHIKSTNILYSSTIGNESCWFRALRQASIRAVVPIYLRSLTPIADVIYTNETERVAQIAWANSIITNSAASTDISTLRINVGWLQAPAAKELRASYHRLDVNK